ncbi:hypothetical protein ACJA27_00910 [Mycoplasmopsis lipophila]|uniref:hypothetical protein n=1 Tax=Mycoplasmopsis lipophila TaxID=2117 RepID=UPI003872B800
MLQDVIINNNKLDSFFSGLLDAASKPWMMAIPIVLTIIVFAFGIILGIFRGVVGFLISFIANISGYITGTFTAGPILDGINKKLPDNNFYHQHYNIFKSLTIPLVVFLFIICFAIAGEIIYWILRRLLLKPMNINKNNGKSNAVHRTLGATLGVISVVPVAIFTINSAAVVSHSNVYSNFNDKLVQYLTFKRGKGLSSEMSLVSSGMKLYLQKNDHNENGVKNFVNLIGGMIKMNPEGVENVEKGSKNEELINKSKTFMKDTLNSELGEKFIGNFIQKWRISGGKNFNKKDIEDITQKKIDDTIKKIGTIGGVTEKGKERFANAIKSTLGEEYTKNKELVDQKIKMISDSLFK